VGGCTTGGNQVTCIFTFPPGPQTWTVPTGVSQAAFTLYGAVGGTASTHEAGGLAARVDAMLRVTAGTVLQVNAGQAGGTSSGVTFGGGGAAGPAAGGGGGATDVRTPAADGTYPLANRLLVAGGGGGGGRAGTQGSGGGGGTADSPGVTGSSAGDAGAVLGGGGGGGAGTTAWPGFGGAGGTVTGTSISPCSFTQPGGAGGNGGTVSQDTGGTGGPGSAPGVGGGGGGGGYYGGGGGGGGAIDQGCVVFAGGGGGGGGASYTGGRGTISDGVAAPDDAPNGEVIIRYTVPAMATTTTLGSSANPSVVDGQVTYTAAVRPVPDGGMVAFTDRGSTIAGCGSQPVSTGTGTGTATCQVTYPAASTHTITAAYSGDASFAASASAALTQQVVYAVRLLYNPATPHRSGATVPIKLQLLNAVGSNVSAPGTVVTFTSLSPSPAPGAPPSGSFTYRTFRQSPGYQLNVRTARYPAGTYTLSFTAGSDPTTHTAQFVVS
jgi:hypothetical protein